MRSLKEKLAGIIQNQIVNPVKQDQPLLGKCERCPHINFSVKD